MAGAGNKLALRLQIGLTRSLFPRKQREITRQCLVDPPFRVLKLGQGPKRGEVLKGLAEAYYSS